MNSQPECKQCGARCAYVFGILGEFLIAAGLVWVMWHFTRPEPLGTERAAFRSKTLKELKASNQDVLYTESYVWQDAAKGVVRMPIDHAMELSLKLWQNPAAARSNLIARVEKATAVAPAPSYE